MISMSEEEFLDMSNDFCGICLACQEVMYTIDPDGRKCKCDNCGEKAVYGIEELLLMGEINIR